MTRRLSTWARVIGLFLGAYLAGETPSAWGKPQVFWASDPVRPDETVLVQGDELANIEVEIARLDDLPIGKPSGTLEVKQWTRVPVLQGSDQSLKFIVPYKEKLGIFAWRLVKDKEKFASSPQLLNAPDVWWVQGDLGASAHPGGWLRVQGKSLSFGTASTLRLVPSQGKAAELRGNADSDGYSVRFPVPADLKPGNYDAQIHNGFGGSAGWRSAGAVSIKPALAWPAQVFNVLDFFGKDAETKMRETLGKYRPVSDCTKGIQAALNEARKKGGGVVYFPAGKYGIKGELTVPPRTVLKGEGMGLVVLWWGSGRFNIDGGDQKGLAYDSAQSKSPPTLISGREFGLEELSLYVPLHQRTAISAADRFHMHRVRVRVDHLWAIDGSTRPEGTIARLGDNFAVTDCDIQAEGAGLIPGRFGVVSGNRIQAGKTNCPLGGSREVIVENNRFLSTYPTAYQNIAGIGRNIYYSRNRHEAVSTHQADFSFTFDSGPVAYRGKVAAVNNTTLTLAADPAYPKWASEKSSVWRQAVVCIQEGCGAGQWRNVTSNQGRQWSIDRPFDRDPNSSSLITIVPLAGRVLVCDNRFEDANWVNASYGTAIDVVYSGNQLYRCGQLLNYGLATPTELQPSWYVQYFDNHLWEGHTTIDTTGSIRPADAFTAAITRCTVHRRNVLDKDNDGHISISGQTRDVIVEGCVLSHPRSVIRAEGEAQGLVFRNNRFVGEPRYQGKRLGDAIVLPALQTPTRKGSS